VALVALSPLPGPFLALTHSRNTHRNLQSGRGSGWGHTNRPLIDSRLSKPRDLRGYGEEIPMTHRLLAALFALSALTFVACDEEETGDDAGGGTNLDSGNDFRNVGEIDLGGPDDADAGNDDADTGNDDADTGVIIDGEECTNGLDDDGDGAIDCRDADCTGNEACESSDTEVACDNGVDDDGDGRADCNDSDCVGQLVCMDDPDMGGGGGGPELCTGNFDEDGDDLIDCFDPDCDFDPACAASVAEDCFNGGDDDGDGLIDCDDTSDCASACGGGGGGGGGSSDFVCLFLCLIDPTGGGICSCGGGGGGGGENCTNGVDDDGNGMTDCADLICLLDPACG
jgi:hypothetical protein